jgi:diacylglycerol kinase (ATP)
MHQIANMLLELDYARNVSIGLVPVGTGSDLARSLGVSQDPAAALEQALAGQSKQIDVLELATDDGRRRFIINVASAGISGLVDQMVNSQPRRTRLAYLRATLAAILSYRPVSCRISIDDQLWYDGSVFLVAVANGKCFGRGMRIAPGAKLDDGQADVVLIQSLAPWQLLLRLHKIYRGAHVQSEHVRHARCKSFRLEPRGPIPPFDLDGEVFPSAAARITVRPGALGVLC